VQVETDLENQVTVICGIHFILWRLTASKSMQGCCEWKSR